MEVEKSQISKFELLNEIKTKIENDKILVNDLTPLLNHYHSLENQDNFNSQSATCLNLLLCIFGEFPKANLRKGIYKVRLILKIRLKIFTHQMKNLVKFFRLVRDSIKNLLLIYTIIFIFF